MLYTNGESDSPQRVAVYARVSSEEQKKNQSIETQRVYARKWLDLEKDRGELMEVAGEYLDDGVSGTDPLEERPGGKSLLHDAKEGKFNKLVFYKIDRLGRDPRLLLNAVHTLADLGVTVKSLTEPFDTVTPQGRFMLNMFASVAGLERDTIIERSVMGTDHWAREGVWLGGITPYGYRKEGDKKNARLVVSEDSLGGVGMTEAEVVRVIYHLCADEGWSTVKIANHLNALGIPPAYTKDNREKTPTGGRKEGKRKEKTSGIWSPSRIRNLIVSTTYKGVHIYGKRSTRNRELIHRKVPAIVPEATWDRAQDTMQSNRHARTWNAKRQYLLRGLIHCQECGLTYHGTASRGPNGKPKAYYTCGGKTAYRSKFSGRCPSKAVNAEWLEGEIWNDIEGFLRNPGEVLDRLADSQEAAQDESTSLTEEKTALEYAEQGKQGERNRILDLYRRNTINLVDLERQMETIAVEENLVKQRIDALRELQSTQESRHHHLENAEELLKELRQKTANPLSSEIRRQIAEALVASITVVTRKEGPVKEAQVTVTYCFDPPESSGAINHTGIRSWQRQFESRTLTLTTR